MSNNIQALRNKRNLKILTGIFILGFLIIFIFALVLYITPSVPLFSLLYQNNNIFYLLIPIIGIPVWYMILTHQHYRSTK